MQPALRVIVSLLLLSSALASYHSSSKLRRDGVLNLYPFPRVGRASRNTWQVPLNELLEYDPIEKRQLYAFPRVGRSEPAASEMLDIPGMWFGPRVGRGDPSPQHPPHFLQMPERRAAQPNMWFGPRVGRTVKSDDNDLNIPNELNDRSEPELAEPTLAE